MAAFGIGPLGVISTWWNPPTGVETTYSPQAILGGIATSNEAIPASNPAQSGQVFWSQNSIFYGQLHVFPSRYFDVGVVRRGGKSLEFAVYNAQSSDVTLTGQTQTSWEGLSTDLESVPIAGWSVDSYTLTVDEEGPDQIDGSVVYEFGADKVRLEVTGQRNLVALWTYPWDWSSTPRHVYKYSTNIIEAWDGTEQRIAITDVPDHNLLVDYLMTGDEIRQVRSTLTGWSAGRFMVPDFANQNHLANAVVAGGNTVELEQMPEYEYAPGSTLIAMSADHKTTEYLDIQAIDGTTITLSAILEKSWPAGTRVAPIRKMIMDQDIQVVEHGHAALGVRMNMTDAEYDQLSLPTNVYTALDGIPLAPLNQNWRQIPSARMGGRFHENMSSQGFRDRHVKNPFLRQERGMLLTFFSRSELAEFMSFMHDMLGSRGSFWIDHEREDIKPTGAGASSGTSYLTVIDDGYAAEMFPLDEYRRVAIHTLSQGVLYRHVTGATTADGITTLQFEELFNNTLPANDIVRISILELCRFGNDQFQINHLTDQVSEISVSLVPIRTTGVGE